MTTIVVFDGSIGRAAIAAFCARARTTMELADPGPVVCDVRGLTEPDAVAIEALARLQLTAHRLGRYIELRDACGELMALLTLAGLRDAIAVAERSGVEPIGQPEQREEMRGVEEEADAGDVTA
ncbi:MAG: STAS domain-containing protein [Actinomycetota bacterium]